MSRVIKSISLPIELNDIVEKYLDKGDLSEYVQECIKKDFTKDYFEKLNERDLKNIEERKKFIEELISKKPKEKESSTEKEKFFKIARIKINENPNFLLGQWEKYKNTFEKISLEEFKEMINEKQKS